MTNPRDMLTFPPLARRFDRLRHLAELGASQDAIDLAARDCALLLAAMASAEAAMRTIDGSIANVSR